VVFLGVWLCLSLCLPLRADEEEDDWPGNRFFLGFHYHQLSFEGELDGTLILGNYERVFFIPKLRPDQGLSLSFGQMRRKGMLEGYILTSSHRAQMQDLTADANYISVGIDAKIYLLSRLRIKPYLLSGINGTWLKVQDGAMGNAGSADATYWGIGINLGLGLMAEISSNLYVSVGYTYRLMGLLYAFGVGKGRDVMDLYVDRWGERRDSFIKALAKNFVVTIGMTI
jgi:opacity protein-like surface antigen